MSTEPVVELETATGFKLEVRPAHPGDEAALSAFFSHVTKEDLRFRFLRSVEKVPDADIAAMTHVDHVRTEDFLALVPGTARIIASVMLAADKAMETAEVAIAIDAEFKGRDIEHVLLEHVTEFAKLHGLKRLQSIESRENRATIELERSMGFKARGVDGDPMLVVLETSL